MVAVTQDGDALMYVSAELRGHREVVMAAVTQESYSLRFASAELRNDREVVMAAVAQKVASTGNDRILLTERNFSPSELVSAANYLNQHYVGFDFDEIRGRLQAELKQLHGDLTTLMSAALQAGNEAFSDDKGQYVITGERNLLEVDDLASNMSRLRELFSLFDQRTQLASLLDLSQRADGVQIFIGGESGLAPLDECSVVTAPYEVQGQVVGTVGVIGPTRMAYERVIPIVDVTAKLLSSALSQT